MNDSYTVVYSLDSSGKRTPSVYAKLVDTTLPNDGQTHAVYHGIC
jgi:hypothetical protein